MLHGARAPAPASPPRPVVSRDIGLGVDASAHRVHRFERSTVEAAEALLGWWRRYPHLRYFQDYFRAMGAFLSDGALPTCRAGVQSFNIDHVGNVAACIERIDTIYGNLKDESLGSIHARMLADRAPIERCQQCWTACRGMAEALGGRGSLTGWRDLATRLRTT